MVFTWLMVVNSKLKGPGILFPSSLGAQDIQAAIAMSMTVLSLSFNVARSGIEELLSAYCRPVDPISPPYA